MATRKLLPVHKENIVKENVTLRGKVTVLPGKGVVKRPELGDITNRDGPKLTARPPIKKTTSFTSLQEVKKTTVITHKETRKNTTLVIKQKKPEEEKKIVIKEDKEETKHPYSIYKFGLVEENDTDPFLVPTYINDIINYLRDLEIEYLVSDMYLTGHKTTPRMRTILVNWLVEIHSHFHLVQETLYLTVSIIDRYLQRNKSVDRETLQLVGITALLVASKYEETYAPEIDDLVYCCDDMFSKQKILQMEQEIIKSLGFKFGNPSSLHFLRRYSKIGKVESIHHVLSKYLLELSLLNHEFSYIVPSLVASSSICMAVQLLNSDNNIVSRIEYGAGYSMKKMKPVMQKLAANVLKHDVSKYQAVKTKYSSKKNCSISNRTELKDGLIKKLAEGK